jgi:hypothetical protein
MDKDTLFMGHKIDYWLELEQRANTLDSSKWIEEISKLRGKISFYESRVKQMVEVINLN